MKRIVALLGAVLTLLAFGPGEAFAQAAIKARPVTACGSAGYTNGDSPQEVQQTATGNLCVTTGAGSGGDASAANQAAVQANAGSDATKAVAVQGVTGGKAVPISAASLPLPTGAMGSSGGTIGIVAGSAVIGHVIADTGSTTAVTGTVTASSTLQTQTDTVMVGGVNVKEINGVTPLMGNGATGTGSVRVTIASDTTANSNPYLVSLQPATSGGMSWYNVEPGASDNHVNIKNGAGQVYSITTFNNSATINYIRLYNAATGFNGCNSATNLVWEGHIPANTSDAGFVVDFTQGIAFSTGISICITGAYGQTSTTSATASAMSVGVGYK